jgi:hypothetical protein
MDLCGTRSCHPFFTPLTHSFNGRIAIKNSQTGANDDTFSSHLERSTFPPNDANSLDLKRSHTDGLIYKVQGINGEFGPERCDVKCEFVPRPGLVGPQFVYGTDWSIQFSIEGEVRRFNEN